MSAREKQSSKVNHKREMNYKSDEWLGVQGGQLLGFETLFSHAALVRGKYIG